jgi:hypothetical protein
MTTAVAFGEDQPIRIAVFQGEGVGSSCESLISALNDHAKGRFRVFRLTAEDIQDGKLSDVDVLVHPGGSGSKQGKALGEKGRNAVRQYVRSGGGYLGVCAGAYLATNDYEWSLNLIDAKVVDKKHWARGTGKVSLRLSPQGSELMRHDSRELAIHYGQGPLLARREWDDPEVPDYESLAIFSTEIAEKGAPSGVMVGTSAVVRGQFGTGRVFCFSPHPELTEGLHHLIPIAVEWLASPSRLSNVR